MKTEEQTLKYAIDGSLYIISRRETTDLYNNKKEVLTISITQPKEDVLEWVELEDRFSERTRHQKKYNIILDRIKEVTQTIK